MLVDTLCVLIMELWFDVSFCIRFLVVFLTLDGSVHGIDQSRIETDRVNWFFLAISHLLDSLVGGNCSILVQHLHHSEVNEFVVGSSLLRIVGELG